MPAKLVISLMEVA